VHSARHDASTSTPFDSLFDAQAPSKMTTTAMTRMAVKICSIAMPAYVVSRVRIHDAANMKRYVTEAPATVLAFGGKYLVRSNEVTALEGTWEHDRMVVVEFPTRDAALAWYESSDYRPLRDLRQASADATILLVPGEAEAVL
jgi:uncharacterized protein (DUF1330 family)